MSLFYEQKHGLVDLSEAERAEMNALCRDYCDFITKAKIEREAVVEAVKLADAAGFVPYVSGMALKAGDRVYYNNRGKGLMLAVIGSDPIEKGAAIVLVSHSMDEVAREAQRLVVFHDAVIPFSGTPAEVFAHGAELEKMGLGVPAMTRIFSRLRAMGADVPASVYTVEQARGAILFALGREDRSWQ